MTAFVVEVAQVHHEQRFILESALDRLRARGPTVRLVQLGGSAQFTVSAGYEAEAIRSVWRAINDAQCGLLREPVDPNLAALAISRQQVACVR